MQNVTIETVQDILKGKISSNQERFNYANGIMFSVQNTNDEILSYFAERGIEVYELVKDIFYTETVMTICEFKNLDHITYLQKLA